jgi:hypothetical protein
MSRLLLRGIHGMCDLNYNAENFWRAEFNWKHPMMYHDENDWCEYKTYATSMLLRQACGVQEHREIDWHRMANLLQMQGPDGLLYIPREGRPWAGEFGGKVENKIYSNPQGSQLMSSCMTGRMLEAAAVYYLLTGDRQWKVLVEKSMPGLRRLAVDKGDYAYYTKGSFGLGEVPVPGPIPPPAVSHQAAWLAHGLITVYRLLGCEQALDLGYKLARFHGLRHSGFVGPHGEFRGHHMLSHFPTEQDPIHFHTNTLIRMLLFDAGIAKGDREMVELAVKGYEFGEKQGNVTLGYYPEWCNMPDGERHSEVCCIADMIYLALRQSTTGVADRWDAVDCAVRNMLAEAQLRETGWVGAYAKNFDKDSPQCYATTDHVPERIRGVFGGFVTPNDWQGTDSLSMISCCVGNGSMTLYRVWRDMIGYDSGRKRLSVHLLMNRTSQWADINSHIPYRGEVDVKLKQEIELALRIPAWANPQQITCKVDGRPVKGRMEGRYFLVRESKGRTLTLALPMSEEKRTVSLPAGKYEISLRGHDVVGITPGGRNYPLFQRARYRNHETQWHEVEQFISDRVITGY